MTSHSASESDSGPDDDKSMEFDDMGKRQLLLYIIIHISQFEKSNQVVLYTP